MLRNEAYGSTSRRTRRRWACSSASYLRLASCPSPRWNNYGRCAASYRSRPAPGPSGNYWKPPLSPTMRRFPAMRLIDFARIMKPGYEPDWYHELIAEHLEACARNDAAVPNVLISCPPGHGKTELTAVLFPAWLLAHD